MLLALCRAGNIKVDGICDPDLNARGELLWGKVPVFGDDDYLYRANRSCTMLVNGLGQTVYGSRREELFTKFQELGFTFPSLLHPFTSISLDAQIADGVQVMAGAVIQPGSSVGANTIINTHASVDHDCLIEEHCHIAPGAILCGGVTVQRGAFISAGATVLPGVTVGALSIVGAGTTLYEDLPSEHKALASKIRTQKLKKGS